MCDTAHQFLKVLEVLGIFSVLDPFADLVAEDASEVFVAREGEEASGVCEHSDKCGDQAHVCQ